MVARALSNNRLAQTNSVARIASPSGITTTAGPGRITIAIPITNTVKPITATTALLSRLNLTMFLIVGWENPDSVVIAMDTSSPQLRENSTDSSATVIPVCALEN